MVGLAIALPTNKMKIANNQRFSIASTSIAVVTYDEAKAYLRLNSDDDQTFVETCINAATDYAESYCRRPFYNRTITANLDTLSFPIYLYGGQASLTSLKYYDSTETEQTLSTSALVVDNSEPVARLYALSSFSDSSDLSSRKFPYILTYTAGFGTTTINSAIKLAILLLVSDMFESRMPESAHSNTLTAAKNLLNPFVLNYPYEFEE